MHKMKIGLGVFVIAAICSTAIAQENYHTGGTIEDCEVDVVRERLGRINDIRAVNAGDLIKEHTAVKESQKGCVDKLKDLAGYINLKMPSGLFSGSIIDKLKDAACDAIVNAANKAIERQRLALTSPYGYIGIDMGLSRNSSGVKVSNSGTLSEPIETIIIKETRTASNKAASQGVKVLDEKLKVKDINRDVNNTSRGAERGTTDNIGGIYDKL